MYRLFNNNAHCALINIKQDLILQVLCSVSQCYLRSVTCLLLTVVFFASAEKSHAAIKTIPLDSLVQHYDLNSDRRSSGLFVCPETLDYALFQDTQRALTSTLSTTTLPDFRHNNRYCFVAKLVNKTHEKNWVLHFSNLFINDISVLIYSINGEKKYHSNLSEGVTDEALNVFGRAFYIDLNPNEDYTFIFELKSNSLVSPPYFSIMTEPSYHQWSYTIGLTFNLAVGVVLGFILMAFLSAGVMKDITFFWFGFSSLLMLVFFTIRSHIGVYLLQGTEDLPPWIWGWASLTSMSILLFVRSFLSIKKDNKYVADLIIKTVVFSYMMVFGLSFFLDRHDNIILYLVCSIIMSLVIFYAGFSNGHKLKGYYLLFILGWLPLFYSFASIAFILTSEPGLYDNTLSYSVIFEPFLQIIHMIIHFMALLMRIVELKKKKYQAEMKSEAKSQFLATVSHDLRQPLHSMSLFVSLLDEHIKSENGKVILAKVSGLQFLMSKSFNQLMDISKLESGLVKLDNEWIDLHLFTDKLRQEFSHQASLKGLSLRFHVTKQAICTDIQHLERILRNLISNAIKYTERGGVLIAFRTHRTGLLIQVWDTGRGIRIEDQSRIFDLYQRGQETKSNQSGMGIGLAIVKQLVDVLGAEIIVRSKPCKGSVFSISLPVKAEYAAEHSGNNDMEKSLRWIAEFSGHTLCDQVTEQMSRWGYKVETHSPKDDNADVIVHLIDITCFSDLSALMHYKDKPNLHIVIGFLNQNCLELINRPIKNNIYLLPAHYQAAQLRSLARFIMKEYAKHS